MKTKQHLAIRKMAMAAVMTALVVVLQSIPIPLGAFTVNLSLVPIVIGAALCGTLVGGWLGLVSGLVILISGQAALFMALDQLGTIITVLVKGIASGVVAGLVYQLLARFHHYAAVLAAAVFCPITNTGIFLVGCRLFFYDALAAEGVSAGYENTFLYLIVVYVGLNFVFEFIFDIVLSPVIVRLLDIAKKKKA